MLSEKQMEILRWPYTGRTALICDGAVRSGKTSIMSLSFLLWAMGRFDRACFGLCGKTVGSAERNIIQPLQAVAYLSQNGFALDYTRSGHVLTVSRGRRSNRFYVFGGRDESSYMCIDLSGASRIPMTKLFGRSPAGMNATGESDMRNYYDYVDTLREAKLRPVLERLLPVVCMSELGGVPEGLEISFPPLWTPSAREVAEIAEKKATAIRDIFQAGLIRADTAQKELKKLAEETGLFGSITGEEIAASRGKTYQDVTALRDPLAGLDFGADGPDELQRDTGDGLTVDYKGQPRAKNGQFTYGKLGGGSTKGKKAGKMKSAKARMGPKEFARVSSSFFTDHPTLKPGTVKYYSHGTHRYRVTVKDPGEYEFSQKKKLK